MMLYAKIRRMYFRKKLSINVIANSIVALSERRRKLAMKLT
jgi:hypothetical protein